jgi:hypothetical protein
MTKRLFPFFVLLVGLGVALLLWQLRRDPQVASSRPVGLAAPVKSGDDTPPASRPLDAAEATARAGSSPPVGVQAQGAERDQSFIDAVLPVFLRPFNFSGKVQDQRGEPVAGAKVRYTINNNPNPTQTGTRDELLADAQGEFTISNHGMGIYIEVSKDGYYRVPEDTGKRGSYGEFRNQDKLGSTDVPMPAAGSPAIFVLHKAGESAALAWSGQKSVAVPKSGSPVRLRLESGTASNVGNLQVEVWTDDQSRDAKGHYPWRCRLTVPGGGIVERTGQFDFVAPAGGYRAAFEITMTQGTEPWRKGFAREFFAKLADGRFARFSFELTTGGDHFLTIEAFVNPTPGDRNLEFDPAKAIPPSP